MPIDDWPPLQPDPVIEYYKQFVDVNELGANLRLTPEERIEKLMRKIQEREQLDRLLAHEPDLQSGTSG